MAVNVLPKCGAGAFSSREQTESALIALKETGFSMDKVSVIAREISQDDEIAESEKEYIRDKTLAGLTKGALTVGTLGSLAGILVGLTTLAIPGLGAVGIAGAKVAIAGMFAGGYYGTGGGAIIGAALGNGASKEQAQVYDNHLANGSYLVIVDGSEAEINSAESILKTQGIQDWGVYNTA